jgi:valyl-tRNA synthetase
MIQPLDKTYDPQAVEGEIYAQWERTGAFRSDPDAESPLGSYTIVIPPPNVTGALHLGHALNNTLQDILIRYHRMRGFNTLWQPGTDHAGIATQAVVERRIREQEGKTRHELGREELVRRIWQWKDEYERRIIGQLKMMGCSCDWERTRFTLDEGMSKAVRRMFFKLFKDGLIFRGKRLVNWDTQLQTAVSDDEVYYETVKGHFWHFKYPVIPQHLPPYQGGTQGGRSQSRDREAEGDHGGSPKEDEPEFVAIATTRPETMLGDTAVAVHPDPGGFLDREEAKLRESLATVTGKDRTEIGAKLEAIAARRESHLPLLIKLRDMARDGRMLLLPPVERKIPLICDEWANPMLGTGCVKITPAHDPNDYEVGLRHNLPMINVLTPDGMVAPIVEPDSTAAPTKPGTSENAYSDAYAGLAFSSDGRAKVVADMESRGLIESIEDRDIEVGHSDRSKLPIEPFLSDQWFVRTNDQKSEIPNRKPEIPNLKSEISNLKSSIGLAQAAMEVVESGQIEVFPTRYAKSYLDWLGEKRDWCISRQLWWGHRIPVWSAGPFIGTVAEDTLTPNQDRWIEDGRLWRRFRDESELSETSVATMERASDPYLLQYCVRDPEDTEICLALKNWGFRVDSDVLDTWFSSGLWPFSTLGWPEETAHLKRYYPGSVLVTSRDIITNWVARMVMFGLYAIGEIPFRHVYIHPKILDGRGETMSKSKGNGVDPIDIIHTHGADALRYSMADLTTETQDIRMPVEYLCPHCDKLTEQAAALKAEEQNRKSRGQRLDRKLQPADCTRVSCCHKECGKEFATQWADAATKEQLAIGRETSEKFEIGRNFCNKLWNAARFAFINLEDGATKPRSHEATEGVHQNRDSYGAVQQNVGRVIDPTNQSRGRQGAELIAALLPEDRWILARLSQTIRRYHKTIAAYQFSASVKELREFFWDSLCDWYIELTKPRLSPSPSQGEGRGEGQSAHHDSARQVLAFCLDQTLRLWHPTIPFITERLWEQLNAIAPRRGLPGIVDLKIEGMLIRAEFPPFVGYPALEDDGILDAFADLQDATRGVRDLRAKCGVPPKDIVTVTVVVPAEHLEAFRSHAHIVRHMAGIGELHVAPTGKRPPDAGSVTIRHLRIFVHNISDDAAERARARKELEALEKQIAGKEAKLDNTQFLANAKPEVVAAERDRLAEFVAQRDATRAHLSELGD